MSFNAALSGLRVANDNLSVIGNNIANASTNGFKRARAEFADVFASGALGGSANAVGTGVSLSSVSQQFTQGTINSADTNLDLAINGSGFFVLNDDGSRVYSRAGAFRIDRNGFITNSQLQRLTGFVTDENGNITGAIGDLQIANSDLDPRATTSLSISLNLDASRSPPTTPFQTGFTPTSPPSSNSFTNSTSTQVFDSLGRSHILTAYFVKTPVLNQWQVFLGVDGTDVTPTSATTPVGTPPVAYANGPPYPRPFTLVFNSAGDIIPQNSASPPIFQNTSPQNSAATVLSTSGTLPRLDLNDLTINGTPVSAATATDSLSTTDALASSIATAAAINGTTNLHGVTATVNTTSFTLTGVTAVGTLAAGQLQINNVNITGAVASLADLQTAINGQTASTGVTATVAGTDIVLTAADGRNIQLQTDGTAAGINSTSFAIAGGTPLDSVQRGTVSLSSQNNLGVTIAGNNPGDVGLSAGPLMGIIQTSSDTISIENLDPLSGANLLNISVSLLESTQFASAFSISALTQDGFATGRLTSIDVDTTGVITARYGNGQSQSLGQVALATFRNEQGLQPEGDTSWTETFSSGVALLGAPGTSSLGLIQSGFLEDSNVALTDELVALIVAQRNFQANAQTIRTADAVTQTIINIR